MPAMIRIKGKPTKIVFDILGKPSNFQNQKSTLQEKVEKRILFENTSRVR